VKRYQRAPTRQFRRDLRRLERSGFDLAKLETVIDILSAGKELHVTHRDHPLKGKLRGARECHIGPDWLLMYKKEDKELLLLLLRTGTHRDVLGVE